MNRMRRQILSEVLTTEKSYVKGLQQLKRDFVHPLSSKLSEVEMANVFPGVNEIWKVHEQLLDRLSKLMGGVVQGSVAGLFSEFAKNCQVIYSPFLNSFSQASVVLKRLMENDSSIAEVVDKANSMTGTTGLKYLANLMITPMQRLPRYELLFKELLKCTSEMHEDHVMLTAALHDIQEACKIINENKRKADEKYRRIFLEQHGSMEVLRAHNWEEKVVSSLKFCGKCEKSIWGLAKKGFKCKECGLHFHGECKSEIGNAQVCLQRRRLDLTHKQLLDQAEVYLMPEDEAALRFGQTNTKTTASKGGSKLLSKPSSGSSGMLGSPSMSRLAHSPAPSRLSHSPAPRRLSTTIPDIEIKGLIFLFDDGIGFAHKWIFDHDQDAPIIDMIGELPYKQIQVRLVTTTDGMHPFVISNDTRGVATFKFYLKSSIEVNNLVKKIQETAQECMETRNLKKSAKMSRKLLAESNRYKPELQHSGGAY